MSHNAAEPQVPAFRIVLREALDILNWDADAIHPGVDFQVKRKLLAAVTSGGAFELLELLTTVNDRSEIVLTARTLRRARNW